MLEAQSQLMAQLAEGEKRLRGLARSVGAVQEAERGRLARELHDGLGQDLTALLLSLQALENDADPELRPRLAGARETAARALAQTRELALLLRPRLLDDLGLGPALAWLCRSFKERAGLDVRVEMEGLEGRLDPQLETLVFRLAQEALTNAAKHADAREALVALHLAKDELRLRIEDAGRGFDAGHLQSQGSGLANLRDRVALWGGRLQIQSRPGEGTRIHVHLPLEGE